MPTFCRKACGPGRFLAASVYNSRTSSRLQPAPVVNRRSRAKPEREMMDEIERRVICDMLERVGWNQTEAAERFQVPLSTLNQKIKRLGIDARRRGAGRASGDPLAQAAETS